MPRLPLLLPVLLLISACSAPAPAPPTDLGAELERIAGEFRTASGVPGLAVGVIRDGNVVYAGGFGTTLAGGGQPVTAATLFHMASITKPFVATAVLQLAADGRVDLDAPVRTYLADFRMRDARAAAITVRQVLSHVAGLPDVTDYAWDRPEYDAQALDRWIRGLADSTLIAAPGERFQYSNIGFELLAHLVARVSGQPFEDYVQARILTPAGMRKSTLLMTDIDSTLLAYGHQPDSAGVQRPTGVYPYNRRHAGSSTLHSNVDDMLRWAQLNLQRGTLDGIAIVDSFAYDRMWKAERDISGVTAQHAENAGEPEPEIRVAVGLSWFLVDRGGRRFVGHSGGDLGFRTDLVLAPDARVAVVSMANGSADMAMLNEDLMDTVLAADSSGRR
jgi:CubicO group peptidase (beta-lactamase class C family)